MEQFKKEVNSSSCLHRHQRRKAPTVNVWIVPVPFYSHVVCFSQFAQQLARQGLAVTLFLTDSDIQRLKTSPDRKLEDWKLQGLDIHLRKLEIEPAALANGIGGTSRFVGPFSQTEAVFEEALKNELEGESKPTYVISDSGLPGVREVASRFNIPTCVFIPVSAGYTGAAMYIRQLVSNGLLTMPDSIMDRKSQEEVISVPGLPLMRLCETGHVNFKDYGLFERGGRCLESVKNHDVILFSDFQELGPRPLQELKKLLKAHAVKYCTKMPRVLTVGPTFPFRPNKASENRNPEVNGAGAQEVHPCIKFLDSQSPSSVVYVAFGTDVNHSPEQIHELIYGLESSQQPFLCVLQPAKITSNSEVQVRDIFSVIPPDFLERTKCRGLFVKWVPQLEVLSHPSTGGFISHCGQNSLLESVCLGVPILAWPCQYDQFLNCRFLVDEAQIGLEVCPGLSPGGFVNRKDVEKSIKILFRSEEGIALRKKALEMKQRAEESVGENGSSTKNMQSLLALIEAAAESNLEKSTPQVL